MATTLWRFALRHTAVGHRMNGGACLTLRRYAAAMGIVYAVQHGEKEREPGDPGLTARGRDQAALAGEWLRDKGLRAVYASPLLRARQTGAAVAAVGHLEAHRPG